MKPDNGLPRMGIGNIGDFLRDIQASQIAAIQKLREMETERNRYRDALVKARDTFGEMVTLNRALGRQVIVEACEIARDGCESALTES